MKLYQIPVSNYSQKALVALYEKGAPFESVLARIWDADFKKEHTETRHPFGKVPVLVLDDGWIIPESSIIVEYLDAHYESGPRLIPKDRDLARQARFHDRMGDLYVMDPARSVLFELRKPEAERDEGRLATWTHQVQRMIEMSEAHAFAGDNTYVLGDRLTFADLAYAIGFSLALRTGFTLDGHPKTKAWFDRCWARPAFARVAAEADAFRAAQG